MLFMAAEGDGQKLKKVSIKAVSCLKDNINDIWTID